MPGSSDTSALLHTISITLIFIDDKTGGRRVKYVAQHHPECPWQSGTLHPGTGAQVRMHVTSL